MAETLLTVCWRCSSRFPYALRQSGTAGRARETVMTQRQPRPRPRHVPLPGIGIGRRGAVRAEAVLHSRLPASPLVPPQPLGLSSRFRAFPPLRLWGPCPLSPSQHPCELIMDLPVEKWKLYISEKLTSLELLMEKLHHSMSLRDTFLHSLTLLCPEDEEYLLSLSRYYCVKKDLQMALSCKEEGNKKFRKREYRTAAALYSRALSHAEGGSPEMAMCYANRSAALFHLGQFEACLEDIRRAQVQGYPEGLLPKLLLRKAECLLSLGRFQEMAEALDSVEEKISSDKNLEAVSHKMLLSKFSQLKVEACKENSSLLCRPALSDRTQKDLEPWEENVRISCASASVSLNFSTCKGRHLVAAEDVLPGEILVREEAFVSVLCPGESFLLRGSREAMLHGQLANGDLHCHHCLRQVLASVSCQGCSYANYCSDTCAQLAWKSYHKVECSLGGLLLTLGVFCHIALRSVLVAGFAEVSTLIQQSHGEDVVVESVAEAPASRTVAEGNLAHCIPGCDADGQYSSSYRTVFSLLPHAEKHSLELRLLCSLSVAALCKGLGDAGLETLVSEKRTSKSQEEPKAGQTSPELEVLGEAMLRHMLQLQCNAQAVSALCSSGPHMCRMGAAERRKRLLSQYFFECRCRPCSEELQPSSRKRVSSQHSLFCCPACHNPMRGDGLLHCSSEACKVLVPEDHFQPQLCDLRLQTEAALELLEGGKPGRSVELLLECRLDAERFLSPAHVMVGEIEDNLAQAYAILGKWQEAAGHLRKSIQSVEARYGPSSIEVGQELLKLAQILFNGRAASEALQIIQKAEMVLSVHFGTRSAQLQELQDMKVCLEDLLGGVSVAAAPKML
ncbi:SET and MYND domain-containing protein 4 isoform X2 [Rhineura floridana]|uniref:SET and MYND domain-containing protein 4 isoform X2 n=1 Tax=Rhineura floridana TaxID=261503 RepID=UPI002AC88EB4|nr:SET and MYND domain-containing protein 4 isoform X2 [Rhineura floridana]